MGKIYLSVIVPAYNEHGNLKRGVLASVWDYLKGQTYSWEVIIVDDGSSDDTAGLAEKFSSKHKGFRVLREPHRGKGRTVISGMLAARGDYVLFTDLDQATPLDQITRLIPKLDKGFDVAIGSRSGRKGAPIVRKSMAYGFTLLRTAILRLPYRDTQCGFKLFKRAAAKKIFKRMKVFIPVPKSRKSKEEGGASVSAGFDLEILYLARKLKLKVAEVPVEWQHMQGTKVNPIKDSWEGFRDLVKVRINALLGKYKF